MCESASPTIQNCEIRGCDAELAGGAIYFMLSSSEVFNLYVEVCTAPYGGGICFNFSNVTLKNSFLYQGLITILLWVKAGRSIMTTH